VPSDEAGDMEGKSIYVAGKIDTTNFVFWHKRDANFSIHLTDSLFSSNGNNITLAINLELEKVLNALEGGVDLTEAVDGNGDGIITIDPDDTDGNKFIADRIMMLLVRHGHCGRKHN
jgi:phosphomannomutase